jgi:hypothetical protein
MPEITNQIVPTPIEVQETSHTPRCRHTGVTFPECGCLHCNRGKLRRYAAAQAEPGRTPPRSREAGPRSAGGALLPVPPGRADSYLHEENNWMPRSAPN